MIYFILFWADHRYKRERLNHQFKVSSPNYRKYIITLRHGLLPSVRCHQTVSRIHVEMVGNVYNLSSNVKHFTWNLRYSLNHNSHFTPHYLTYMGVRLVTLLTHPLAIVLDICFAASRLYSIILPNIFCSLEE